MDITDTPNRIQVVVRVRPVLPHELSDEVAVTCSQDARRLQVLLPDRFSGGATLLPGATRSGARSYEFDACLNGGTSQEELYDVCGLSELVEAALDGYCVTIFAFGQTGSGKTHTIIGPRLSRGERQASSSSAAGGGSSGTQILRVGSAGDRGGYAHADADPGLAGTAALTGPGGGMMVDPEDGILTRAIASAYRSIEARAAAGTAEFSVSASVVELYNEGVTDLLALDKSKTLQVRKDARDGFAVVGLTQVQCPTDTAAVRYMVRALQYRHTRGHRLNEYSSRSHCVMTFVFASRETGPDGQMGAKGGIRRYGKLCLVDLAGSERLKETGNTERGAVRETGAINKSLFVLGQVLAALSARSTGTSTSTFVPYRDSKLTQLLWDGLRGNGRCLMLACLGPMRCAADESLNTLHFATMALRIKAEPVVLLDPQDQLVLDLRKTITHLRHENRQLAGALQQLSQGLEPASVLATLPDTLRATAANMAATAAGTGAQSMPVTPTVPHGSSPGGYVGSPDVGLGRAAGGVYGSASVDPRPMQKSDSGTSTGSGYHVPYSGGGGLGTSMGEYPSLAGGQAGALRGSVSSTSMGGVLQRVGAGGEVASPSGSSAGRQQQRNGLGAGARRAGSMGQSYGSSPARSRAGPPGSGGSRAAGGAASSPRSLSVGRNGGGANRQSTSVAPLPARPSYLTEDPGALLYGLGGAAGAQSSPQVERSGGVGGGIALPALPPQRKASSDRPMAPPPPAAVAAYPELAAMEAAFQSMLAGGQGPGVGGSGSAGRGPAARGLQGEGEEVGVREEDAGPRPDVRALRWAERNSWFGSDYDMTAYAYQVHDQLVDVERVDPTSETYYTEIERRVSDKFPDKWARHVQQLQHKLQRASQLSPSGASRQPPPAPTSPHFGAGLRVNVKEPLLTGSVAAGSYPANGRAGSSGPAGESGGFEYGELQLSSVGTPPLQPGTPAEAAGVNPFNIGALHAVAPPRASRIAAATGVAGYPPGGGETGYPDPGALDQIKKEYARQRAMVVEELRRAKEDAEAERQRILARIQRAASGGKLWRS